MIVASLRSRSSSVAWTVPRIVAALLLFSVAGLFEIRNMSSLSSLSNSDVWWHLTSGLWMLQHRALPHTGIFSQAANQNWIAWSWLYDLKLAVFDRLVGLRAIPIFAIFLKAGLAIVTFFLAGGCRGRFWTAFGLSAVAQYVLEALPTTPAYCSALLFGIALLMLMAIRRSSNVKVLFWLVPLFLVWGNVDIHFVYGLALLLLFSLAEAVGKMLGGAEAFHGSTKTFSIVAAAAFLATVITPYFYRPWQVFFSSAFSAANSCLPDYKAPGFRQPQDYVLLVLVMSAFLALGLRRSRDTFLILLLAICAVLSFHSQRDIWLVVLAAAAAIGEMTIPIGAAAEPAVEAKSVLISVMAAMAVLILAAAFLVPRPEALLAKAARSYPVAASDYIREHHLPQPIFNAFEWGGFLSWYLPDYPVAIDSRVDLYGDDFVIDYTQMMSAKLRYSDFPALANAATIVLPHSAIIAQALSTLPAYKVVYSDDVATVLAKN
jgi:hypothetical protein